MGGANVKDLTPTSSFENALSDAGEEASKADSKLTAEPARGSAQDPSTSAASTVVGNRPPLPPSGNPLPSETNNAALVLRRDISAASIRGMQIENRIALEDSAELLAPLGEPIEIHMQQTVLPPLHAPRSNQDADLPANLEQASSRDQLPVDSELLLLNTLNAGGEVGPLAGEMDSPVDKDTSGSYFSFEMDTRHAHAAEMEHASGVDLTDQSIGPRSEADSVIHITGAPEIEAWQIARPNSEQLDDFHDPQLAGRTGRSTRSAELLDTGSDGTLTPTEVEGNPVVDKARVDEVAERGADQTPIEETQTPHSIAGYADSLAKQSGERLHGTEVDQLGDRAVRNVEAYARTAGFTAPSSGALVGRDEYSMPVSGTLTSSAQTSSYRGEQLQILEGQEKGDRSFGSRGKSDQTLVEQVAQANQRIVTQESQQKAAHPLQTTGPMGAEAQSTRTVKPANLKMREGAFQIDRPLGLGAKAAAAEGLRLDTPIVRTQIELPGGRIEQVVPQPPQTQVPQEQVVGILPSSASTNQADQSTKLLSMAHVEANVRAGESAKGQLASEFEAQVMRVLTRRSLQGELQLQLQPRALGLMDIRVQQEQGEVSIVLIPREQPARELLEQLLPRLRQNLQEAGVSIGDLDVQQDHPREHDRHGEQMPASNERQETIEQEHVVPLPPSNARGFYITA